jgi:hypothetical protein
MSLTDAHLLLHKTGDTPYPSKKTETIIWGGTSPFHTYKETRLGSARLFFSRVRRVYSTWFKKLQFRSESSSPSSLRLLPEATIHSPMLKSLPLSLSLWDQGGSGGRHVPRRPLVAALLSIVSSTSSDTAHQPRPSSSTSFGTARRSCLSSSTSSHLVTMGTLVHHQEAADH